AGASRPPGKPIAGPPAQRSVADLRSLPAAPQTHRGSMLFHSIRRMGSGATGQLTNPGARDFGPRALGFGLLDPLGYGAPAVITGFNGIDINDSAGTGESCFCLPPDGDMAAGPNHVIVGVNLAFRVFDKSGSPLTPSTSYDAFFN